MIGFRLDKDTIVSAFGFADNLVSVASMPDGLLESLTKLSDCMAAAGLEVNIKTCANLHIDIDGHVKRWVINPTERYQVGGKTMKAMSIIDTYMGLETGAQGMRKATMKKLNDKLRNITRAPLKS
jgi:hypothetical protein